ncbi:MAG: hypothetical protein JWR24_4755 [Actinoallomurus sp.]|nr:hypothetical protein [Actinoallomurus sp.]
MTRAVAVAARGFFSWLAAVTATGVVVLCTWAWFGRPPLTRRHIVPQAGYGPPGDGQ